MTPGTRGGGSSDIDGLLEGLDRAQAEPKKKSSVTPTPKPRPSSEDREAEIRGRGYADRALWPRGQVDDPG